MRKIVIGAAGALAIAGCGDINVTSNDAATQNALNQAEATARDVGNDIGRAANDAGDTLSNVADRAGEEVRGFGNRTADGDADGERAGNGATGNRQ